MKKIAQSKTRFSEFYFILVTTINGPHRLALIYHMLKMSERRYSERHDFGHIQFESAGFLSWVIGTYRRLRRRIPENAVQPNSKEQS